MLNVKEQVSLRYLDLRIKLTSNFSLIERNFVAYLSHLILQQVNIVLDLLHAFC